MKRTVVLLAAALAAADQLVKRFVRATPRGSLLFSLPPLFELTHSTNTGAAFSLFSGRTAGLALSSVALLCALWLVLRRLRLTRAGRLAIAALLGGGIGNLIDRVLFGRVTDYIRLSFVDFPVFNLADIFITVSVFVLMLLLLTGRLEERD